jgi:hypothetical protein
MVHVEFGSGAAGWTGRRLARSLGIPKDAGVHHWQVSIRSDDGVLHWDRCFDARSVFHSTFTPVGNFPDGHWIESAGALRLLLAVDPVRGGKATGGISARGSAHSNCLLRCCREPERTRKSSVICIASR